MPATAEDRPATPEAFVRALYKDYGRDDRLDTLGTTAPRFFAPPLLKLIRTDERTADGGIGRLDEDPLCDCQDDDGFRLSSVAIGRRTAADQAIATVHLALGAIPKVIVLDLVTNSSGWRVADVHSRTIPSLTALLSTAAAPH